MIISFIARELPVIGCSAMNQPAKVQLQCANPQPAGQSQIYICIVFQNLGKRKIAYGTSGTTNWEINELGRIHNDQLAIHAVFGNDWLTALTNLSSAVIYAHFSRSLKAMYSES
jgi:hypothetical protein